MDVIRRSLVTALLPLTLLGLAGCASPPAIIAEDPPARIVPREAQSEPQRFIGKRVRWGGVILATENRSDSTVLTLLAYPLDATARPEIEQAPMGRFQAVLSGFRDPAVYKDGREITVVGAIDAVTTAKVGEFEYDYPVVSADKYYLWQPRVTRRDDYYPYYDPFFDPFYYPYYRYYPYYYYPYYPRRHIEGIETQ